MPQKHPQKLQGLSESLSDDQGSATPQGQQKTKLLGAAIKPFLTAYRLGNGISNKQLKKWTVNYYTGDQDDKI